VNRTEARLGQLRGAMPTCAHNARTIAALTSNPGCARRAILDAAGIVKQRLAGYAGFPAPFGQSRFAITRGRGFEAQVKASGCAELLRLLRDQLGLPIPEVSYDDLEEVGGNRSLDLRHARTRTLLARSAASGADAGTLFDHPLLRLAVAGRSVYLEPDLIAFRLRGQFRVVEIKSFAAIDGQADPDKVRAAAISVRRVRARPAPAAGRYRGRATGAGVRHRGPGLPGELLQQAGRRRAGRAQAADGAEPPAGPPGPH